MVNVNIPKVAYDLMQIYNENIRIKKNEIRQKVSPYSTIPATRKLFNQIREKEILFGPELWINSGFVVDLIKNSKKSCLTLFDQYKKDPQMVYIIALMGSYALLSFKRGASILKNALCVFPSFPAQKTIVDIELTEKGLLERNEYPHNWDELDWKVFFAMEADPTRSFGKVGGELGVTWNTVRDHFEKILPACEIWTTFYPKGYKYYQKALLKFDTKYEKNLWDELKKIDRSSFIHKYDNTILLILFYEDFNDLKRFELLKKEGKIKNLSFSTPITWL